MLTHRVRLGNRDRTEVCIEVNGIRILIARDKGRSDILVGVDAPREMLIDKAQSWPEQPLPEEGYATPDHMEALLRQNRTILSINVIRGDNLDESRIEGLRDAPAA